MSESEGLDRQWREHWEAESADDFDAGFDAGGEEGGDSGREEEGNGEKGELLESGGDAAFDEEKEKPAPGPEARAEGSPAPSRTEEIPPEARVPEPGEGHRAEARDGDADRPPEKARIEVPEGMESELEELKRIDPKAAELALEDSPDGESIRIRLSEMGALAAQDRAEFIQDRRNRELRAEREESERRRRAVEEHNRHFMGVLRRDHPEYAAMLEDLSRRAEAEKMMRDIFEWIGTKPYAEAAPLMETARYGRDPEKVSALIAGYKSERGKKAAPKAGPEGAFAVPGRGAAHAPTGDEGNADDFDAGFNL